jgi:hypothetical protein
MWLGMLSTITVELFFLSNVFFILVILFFLDFRNMMDIYNKLYHIMLYRVGFKLTTLIGTDCIGSYKSDYHTITTMTAEIWLCFIFKGTHRNSNRIEQNRPLKSSSVELIKISVKSLFGCRFSTFSLSLKFNHNISIQ